METNPGTLIVTEDGTYAIISSHVSDINKDVMTVTALLIRDNCTLNLFKTYVVCSSTFFMSKILYVINP